MPRPVHFEIHASDPARAIRFYERTFGWIFQQWGEQEYWLITTGSADEPDLFARADVQREPVDHGSGLRAGRAVREADVLEADVALRHLGRKALHDHRINLDRLPFGDLEREIQFVATVTHYRVDPGIGESVDAVERL